MGIGSHLGSPLERFVGYIDPVGCLCTKGDRRGSLLERKIWFWPSHADAMPGGTRQMICPMCHGNRVHRSRRRGIIEGAFLAVIFVKSFRCQACDARVFRHSPLIPFRPGCQRPSDTAVRPLSVSGIIHRFRETIPYWTGALRSGMASFLIAWGKN